jgi:hypothetical protein
MLLELSPGLRTILVGDLDCLMNGLVNFLLIAKSDLNASLIQNALLYVENSMTWNTTPV